MRFGQKGNSVIELILLFAVSGIVFVVSLYTLNANQSYNKISSGNSGGNGSATLSGTVSLGPTSPTCVSAPRTSAAQPPATNCGGFNPLKYHKLDAVNYSGKVVASSKTDDKGYYILHLNPGHYSIKFDPSVGIVSKDNQVDIHSGSNTFNFYLDTGIR